MQTSQPTSQTQPAQHSPAQPSPAQPTHRHHLPPCINCGGGSGRGCLYGCKPAFLAMFGPGPSPKLRIYNTYAFSATRRCENTRVAGPVGDLLSVRVTNNDTLCVQGHFDSTVGHLRVLGSHVTVVTWIYVTVVTFVPPHTSAYGTSLRPTFRRT